MLCSADSHICVASRTGGRVGRAHLRDGGVQAERLGDAGVEVDQLAEAVVGEEARELRHAGGERLVVGVSAAARCLATRSLAFRMSVLYFDPLYEVLDPPLIHFYPVICAARFQLPVLLLGFKCRWAP